MSTEIIYDKQFIDLGNGLYVPMFLQGSSNCTEMKRVGNRYIEIRERSWSNPRFHLNGKTYGTLEEITISIDSYRDNLIEKNKGDGSNYQGDIAYNDKSFGWFVGLAITGKGTGKTSFGMYKGLYSTGVKNAMTVEELLSERIRVSVHVYENLYNNELKAAGKEARTAFPKTSEELKNVIDEFEAYYANTKINFWLSLDMSDSRLKDMRRTKSLNTKKESVKEVSEYFIFQNENGVYFAGGLKRSGYRYTHENNYLTQKKYDLKSAKARLKELNKKYNTNGVWAIITVKLEKPIMV